MKTLFLLLIIYNFQNFAFSHNVPSIIYKKYPKKVHAPQENIKLINTHSGRYQQQYEKRESDKLFQPQEPEWSVKPKIVQPLDSSYLDFFGNLKSRVKRTQYYDDYKRVKRDANKSPFPAAAPAGAQVSKDVPKAKDAPKSEVAPKVKAGEVKPKDKQVDVASSKAPAHPTSKKSEPKVIKRNGQSGVSNHKPAQQLAKQPAKHPAKHPAKPSQKLAKRESAKKSPSKQSQRSSLRQGKKRSSHKRALRKRKRSQSRSGHSLRQGKPALPRHAGGKPVGKHQKPKSIARSKPIKRKAPASRRLIAARDANPADYPYMVSIQKHGQHWCAGAILNERLVITTANCFWKSRSISRMLIRAGATCVDSGGQTAYIAELVKHPRWSIRRDPDNDLALALLDRSLKFSDSVHGVDLPNKVMMPPFEDAWVTSYGADRRDGIFGRSRQTLQVVYVRLIPEMQCSNLTARFNVRLTANFVCLAQAGRRAPCTRDTGAPAVSDGILWGLASWGIRKLCGTERFPAMFSYVASQDNMEFIINATARLMSEERLESFLDRVPPAPLRVRGRNGGIQANGLNLPIDKHETMPEENMDSCRSSGWKGGFLDRVSPAPLRVRGRSGGVQAHGLNLPIDKYETMPERLEGFLDRVPPAPLRVRGRSGGVQAHGLNLPIDKHETKPEVP